MQQSEQQALNKFSARKGDIFGRNIQHWLTCTRCSSICVPAAPTVQIQIGCHVKYVESLSQLLRVAHAVTSAGSKLRTTAFCGLRLKSKLVNSNVPHLRSLVSGSCIEIIVQVKIVELCFQLKQTHDCSVVGVVRTRSDYKLGHLNSRSSNGEIRAEKGCQPIPALGEIVQLPL